MSIWEKVMMERWKITITGRMKVDIKDANVLGIEKEEVKGFKINK